QALRSLARSPWYAVTAIAMLGAGLGLTMYMFGAINSFLLRPLPFAHADRLAHVELADLATGQDSIEVPTHDYLELARAQRSFESFAAFSVGTLNLSGDDRPERFEGGFVTDAVFETLGETPLAGREFEPADYVPGAPPVVVISHALWQSRYAGDPGIVGRTIRANGKPATIVGVMRAGFEFPFRQDVWTTASLDVANVQRKEATTLEVIGRLAPGVGLAQAREELDAIYKAVSEADPEASLDRIRTVVKSLNAEYIGRNTASVLTAMMIAVLLVLVIACANVANLMIARTVERTRELAIHGALGAARMRLVLRLVLEGALIALVGGGIGFVCAMIGGEATMRVLTENENGLPYWLSYAIDARIVLFSIAIALVGALSATIVPALRAGRIAAHAAMREGGHGATGAGFGRASRVLVTGQLALCAVLLVVAGLTVRSILAMQTIDPGAETEGVLTARLALFEESHPTDADVVAFFERLEHELAASPGVERAAVTTSVPLSFAGGTYYHPDGKPPSDDERYPFGLFVAAAPSYFEMFEVPLLLGRAFDSRDRADAPPVVLVSERFVEDAFEGRSPVGRRIDLDPNGKERRWAEIVGVVGQVVQTEPDDASAPVIYAPFAQRPQRFASIAVRARSGDPHALADTLRAAVTKLDRDLPVYFVRTADEWVASQTIPDRLMAKLFAIFAAFGLLLAATGIYAMLAFAVAQRTREIGVRRALGALDAGIVRMVMGQGMRQLAVGLAIGLVLGFGLAQVLRNVLFGVETFDPLTFGAVGVVLALAMLIATFAPTRRALRVEPMQALRNNLRRSAMEQTMVLWNDLNYGVRLWIARPAFVASAIAALAIGLSAIRREIGVRLALGCATTEPYPTEIRP
ncbi:MAG TPA: ABC transporter permease, partial [Candidatus Saccharimonadia bacterium]|nr:ABC transporter permease [Candidatus Saccharimonadia bacterium]